MQQRQYGRSAGRQRGQVRMGRDGRDHQIVYRQAPEVTWSARATTAHVEIFVMSFIPTSPFFRAAHAVHPLTAIAL